MEISFTKDTKFGIPSGIYLRYEDIHTIRKFLNSEGVHESLYFGKKVQVPEVALRLLLQIINKISI